MAGVVLAPALGELFFAAPGLGVWKRDGQGTRAMRFLVNYEEDRPLRVIGSRSHGGGPLSNWLAQLPCQHDFLAAGSSLKFCRIAEGAADIYPRFGPTSQWDTAAASVCSKLLVAWVTDLVGQALTYGMDRVVLNPSFVAAGDSGLLGWVDKSDDAS